MRIKKIKYLLPGEEDESSLWWLVGLVLIAIILVGMAVKWDRRRQCYNWALPFGRCPAVEFQNAPSPGP